MSIKAVFTDLDGTLLNEKHEISPFTASVIQALKAKGIYFIVATGRPYPDVFCTLKQCNLQPDFIITSNGGRIHDSNHNVIAEHNMSPEIVESLAQIREIPHAVTGKMMPKTVTSNIYKDASWLTDRAIPEIVDAFHKDFLCTDLGDGFRQLRAAELTGVHEMWFLGETEELKGLQKYLSERYGNDLCSTFSMPYILDCVSMGVRKGHAVEEVSQLLKIDLSETACFGDGMNDESMLKVSGYPFIMENGQKALKDGVPHAEIIGVNKDDGVAKKLVQLFGL